MGRDRIVSLSSPEETIAFGKFLASCLSPGSVLALSGDLGSGKTTFVQGLALGLGIEVPIQSPTFVFLNHYSGTVPLFHFDLYRMKGVEDFLGLGFEEYFDEGGICAIEWSERIASLLPLDAWHITFSYDDTGRKVSFPDLLINK
jgi:tRNA threonylcarbamoyladenosine biosynthesis protein TsaE